MVYTITLTNIVWDKDSDGNPYEVDLPTTLTVKVSAEKDVSSTDLHDMAIDKISDIMGFCIESSDIEDQR